jgi:predicted PurR-regulated permease PerM
MAPTPLRRKGVFLAISGLALLVILYAFRSILVPFILALALAYVFSPVVTWITRLGGKKRPLPRWVAVLGLYTALLAGMVLFSVAFLPRLADELGVMMKEIPAAFRHVREEWLPALAEAYEENLSPLLRSRRADVISRAEPRAEEPEQDRSAAIVLRPARDGSYRLELQDLSIDVSRVGKDTVVLNARAPSRGPPEESGSIEQTITDVVRGLLERGQEHATVLFSVGQEVVLFLIGFAFTFFITLMLSAFILADQERLLAFFESLVPEAWRSDYRKVLHSLDQGLAGVVRGQILICLINGTLSGIGFAVLDLRYWPVLTAIATVFTLIPIFGTIISSIPAIMIGLTQSLTTGLFVFGWITIIHLMEAYVLDPKIIGKTARIHPVVIFFALIAGERAAGLLGVLLGVPVASIIQNIFLFWKNRLYAAETEPDPPGGGNDAATPGAPTDAPEAKEPA